MSASDDAARLRIAGENLTKAYDLLKNPGRDEELWAALKFAHEVIGPVSGVKVAAEWLERQSQLVVDEAENLNSDNSSLD